MMMLPSGIKVHIAAGVTDMRKGMDGLAMLVEAVLREDPVCLDCAMFITGRRSWGSWFLKTATWLDPFPFFTVQT